MKSQSSVRGGVIQSSDEDLFMHISVKNLPLIRRAWLKLIYLGYSVDLETLSKYLGPLGINARTRIYVQPLYVAINNHSCYKTVDDILTTATAGTCSQSRYHRTYKRRRSITINDIYERKRVCCPLACVEINCESVRVLVRVAPVHLRPSAMP